MAERKTGSDKGGGTPGAVTSRGDGHPMTPSEDVTNQLKQAVNESGITPECLDEVRDKRRKSAHGPHNKVSGYRWSK